MLADGATTHYVYGAGGLLSGEYDNTGGLIREYVYHYGQPVAQIDGGVSETLIYLHTDHLGTPRVASNSSGTQVWSWNSDAFGVGAPTGTAEVNLRFAGQYFDAESGLHYNWNRYYNPATGRYVSSDPIGLSGGINTYGYVEANPVMYVDPEGLLASVCRGQPWLAGCSELEGGGGAGGGGAVGGVSLGAVLGLACEKVWDYIFNNDSSDDEGRNQEHKSYKDSRDKPHPKPNTTEPKKRCDHHLAIALQSEKAARDMEQFDIKWNQPGRHAQRIREEKARAKKLGNAIKIV